MDDDNQIIIAGAGPVGYAAALNLANFGIPFILLEAEQTIMNNPRAGTIHPPTLEMFNRLGQADTFIRRGYVVTNYHYRDRKIGLIADFDLGVLSEDTPYPFRLMLEQHKISNIIDNELKLHQNHTILRNHRIVAVEQNDKHVLVRAQTPNGLETFKGRYLIGCDGGRSLVRKFMNVIN